jgi:hypothetical protein
MNVKEEEGNDLYWRKVEDDVKSSSSSKHRMVRTYVRSRPRPLERMQVTN